MRILSDLSWSICLRGQPLPRSQFAHVVGRLVTHGSQVLNLMAALKTYAECSDASEVDWLSGYKWEFTRWRS